MTIIPILEILLIIVSLLTTFFVTLGYLVRFQRKIDRMLILTALSSNRLEDMEQFLEKHTKFKAKKQIEESTLPELNTDFI